VVTSASSSTKPDMSPKLATQSDGSMSGSRLYSRVHGR
jgi:hypothetical protein